MTNPGTLHGVGVGPGDPELVTVRAARLIGSAPVLAYFAKKGRRGNARAIIEPYVRPGTEELPLYYPLTTEMSFADPVYVDTNVMAGRTGVYRDGRYEGIVYLDSTRANNFVPELPREEVDLIYLCFPNNPTGSTITREQLKVWVDFARDSRALILFDAAYEAFIRDPDLPHSIYEIPGAREVAIEFRSFSKSAGFTGTRCAYTVVPKECMAFDAAGNRQAIHPLWNRRHCTKFNGVSYPVQRAAEAVYSPAGQAQCTALIGGYLHNAALIRAAMTELGFGCVGGDNAPYVWIDGGRDSWEFFDLLLNRAGVVCTPGAGFGRCGQGYIRLSAFNSEANVIRAMERIRQALG